MWLIAKTRNTHQYGTVLELWEVGATEPKIIERPFDPFFYSHINRPGATAVKKRLLERLDTEKTIYKKPFENTDDLRESRDDFSFQDNIPYNQLVAALLGFKKESPAPSHYAFDIETHEGKIIACGWYDPKIQEVFTGSQATILSNLNDVIEDKNPDILDSYWGSYFDVKKIMDIAAKIGVKVSWGRDGSKPYIWTKQYSRGPKKGIENKVRIRGRVHFDVYKEVELDQTLSGIKNKRLQTVAEWFDLGEPTKFDHSKLISYGMEVVKSECLEDCRKTWLLAEHYLKNCYHLADLLELSLNLVVERSPSHPANYIYMRDYDKLGIVSSSPNYKRFKEFFAWGRKAYQGAFVKLYNPGIFTDFFNLDFKGMYPVIMLVFGLDPTTVKFLGIDHSQRPDWIVKFEDDIIHVYDTVLKGVFSCRISLAENVSKKRLVQLLAWREQVKEGLRQNPDDPELWSRQYAIKVIMNALYGYHGMRHARYGYAPIAAIVTGIGRWWLTEGVKFVASRVDKVIEADTDGIYIVGPDLSQELESHIKSLIPARYDPGFISIAAKHYDGGIFYEEKGHVLRRGEKNEFHGSGLLGRHHPKVCDMALEEVVNAIFNNENILPILWRYTRLQDYPFEDFVMTVELRQKPADYDEGTMWYNLIDYYKRNLKDIHIGQEVRYVKTKKHGYKPINLPGRYDLDYAYYRGRIASSLARILKPTKKLAVSTLVQIIRKGQMILG